MILGKWILPYLPSLANVHAIHMSKSGAIQIHVHALVAYSCFIPQQLHGSHELIFITYKWSTANEQTVGDSNSAAAKSFHLFWESRKVYYSPIYNQPNNFKFFRLVYKCILTSWHVCSSSILTAIIRSLFHFSVLFWFIVCNR